MLSNSKIRLPNVVSQAHGNRAVSAMWKDHYSQIFNVVNNSDSSEMYRGMCKDRGSSNDRIPLVNCGEVLVAINGLSANKSPGLDGLSSEHLKFADRQLSIILSVLTTATFSHGHNPEVILKSVILPIIKDKNKRINDKDNYRPICLPNVFTKVIEQILLKRLHPFLKTTENQYGFKPEHGTEMCVDIIPHGSNVYVAYLDASKAFDRVNHNKMFSKLCILGIPKYIITVLCH